VVTRVDVGCIDQGGEGDGDSISQLLLISKTNLATVIDLGSDNCTVGEDILGSEAELGGGVGAAPAEGDTSL